MISRGERLKDGDGRGKEGRKRTGGREEGMKGRREEKRKGGVKGQVYPPTRKFWISHCVPALR